MEVYNIKTDLEDIDFEGVVPYYTTAGQGMMTHICKHNIEPPADRATLRFVRI